MASPPSKKQKGDGLLILNAGLFRTGTKSMALAYQQLGFPTHHGLLEDMTDTPWAAIERAAEATWPDHDDDVPGARRRPRFQRGDWDELWGGKYDAVTDLACFFVPELIKAYPEAKVVVVQRPFEEWWPSFKEGVLDKFMPQPQAAINGFIGWYFLRIRAVQCMRKCVFGFFRARSEGEVHAHAREAYKGYYRAVRAMVPEERRLEYKLGDGWGPLCEFLGVDVPDCAFPRENDKMAHGAESEKRLRRFHGAAVRFGVPAVAVLGVAIAATVYMFSTRGQFALVRLETALR